MSPESAAVCRRRRFVVVHSAVHSLPFIYTKIQLKPKSTECKELLAGTKSLKSETQYLIRKRKESQLKRQWKRISIDFFFRPLPLQSLFPYTLFFLASLNGEACMTDCPINKTVYSIFPQRQQHRSSREEAVRKRFTLKFRHAVEYRLEQPI